MNKPCWFLMLIFLLLSSCGPTKEYYKFKFTTFQMDIDSDHANENDSVVILKAVSPVDEKRLLSYDKRELEDYAFLNGLKVNYSPTETSLEKVVPLSDSTRKDALLLKTQRQMQEIRDLKYYGIAAAKDTSMINDERAFQRHMIKRRNARTVGSAVGVGLLIYLIAALIATVWLIFFLMDAWEKTLEGGCYIATACYGSYDAPEVLVLRKFRDQVLKKYFLGRVFIKVYYSTSPAVARRLRNAKPINRIVRKVILNPFVRLLSKRMS